MSFSDPDLNDRIPVLSSAEFNATVLDGAGPVAVEFMAYSCGHCKEVEPFLQQVAETLDGKEQIFRVDCAAEPELATGLNVQGTPTFIMFLDGREVGRVEGVAPTLSDVMDAVTEPFNIQP